MLIDLINGVQWDTDKAFCEQTQEAQNIAFATMAGTPIEADDETCRNNVKRPTYRAYNFYGGFLQVNYTYLKGPMSKEFMGISDQKIEFINGK